MAQARARWLTPNRLAWAGALTGALTLLAALWALIPKPGEGMAASGGFSPDAVGEFCVVAPTYPFDAASGRAMADARPVPKEARCPVCGMFVAQHPKWAAQAIFRDGHVQFFDSPLDLFLHAQHVDRFTPGRSGADVVARHVADWRSGAWLVADAAVYVHGSKQLGPMRSGNLPAFADAQAAAAFIAEYGGITLHAAQLRQALPPALQQLGPAAHDHEHAASAGR